MSALEQTPGHAFYHNECGNILDALAIGVFGREAEMLWRS